VSNPISGSRAGYEYANGAAGVAPGMNLRACSSIGDAARLAVGEHKTALSAGYGFQNMDRHNLRLGAR